MNAVKVTFLLPGYPWKPVGGIRVVYQYANELVSQGHAVSVVHARQFPAELLPPANVAMRLRRRADYARNLFFRPPTGWQRLDPRVRMLFVPDLSARYVPDADAVIATWWGTAEFAAAYPSAKGVPCHLVQHYEVWGGQEARVQAAWRLPTLKFVIARWLYRKGVEMGIPKHDLVHVPNGIDHAAFYVTYPLEHRPSRVAMLYSRQDWKGGADGVAALMMARQAVPELRATLFGVDASPRGLPRWMEYSRNPAQEVLRDRIYNSAAVYLSPSWSEGWGLPAGEAMACGCAVVSADNGGVRDFAEDGVTALVRPVRNPAALAEAVVSLLRDDEHRIALAITGRQQIQQFTWPRSTEILLGALRERVGNSQSVDAHA